MKNKVSSVTDATSAVDNQVRAVSGSAHVGSKPTLNGWPLTVS